MLRSGWRVSRRNLRRQPQERLGSEARRQPGSRWKHGPAAPPRARPVWHRDHSGTPRPAPERPLAPVLCAAQRAGLHRPEPSRAVAAGGYSPRSHRAIFADGSKPGILASSEWASASEAAPSRQAAATIWRSTAGPSPDGPSYSPAAWAVAYQNRCSWPSSSSRTAEKATSAAAGSGVPTESSTATSAAACKSSTRRRSAPPLNWAGGAGTPRTRAKAPIFAPGSRPPSD